MRGEVRLAMRGLAHEPALACAAVLTLAIGASTGRFSILEAVLVAPMDVAPSRRLVVMWPQTGDTSRDVLSFLAVQGTSLIGGLGVLPSYLPARRAAAFDPASILRDA